MTLLDVNIPKASFNNNFNCKNVQKAFIVLHQKHYMLKQTFARNNICKLNK